MPRIKIKKIIRIILIIKKTKKKNINHNKPLKK